MSELIGQVFKQTAKSGTVWYKGACNGTSIVMFPLKDGTGFSVGKDVPKGTERGPLLGAVKERKSRTGEKFYSGNIGELRVVMFKNNKKQTENDADFTFQVAKGPEPAATPAS